MSTQITIEDLRYIVAQQYKPKGDLSDTNNSYMNRFFNYANNIMSMRGKDYYDWLYNTSADIYEETSRTTGVPSRKALTLDDLWYYDVSKKFEVL